MLPFPCALLLALFVAAAAHESCEARGAASLKEETSLLALDQSWGGYRRHRPHRSAAQCFRYARKPISRDSKQDASTVCSWDNKFIVTRLWTVDPYQTQERVIREFERGYAPQVRKTPGFLSYLGAKTDDPRRVFFANVFETKEGAEQAQQGAADFRMRNPNLGNSIIPFLFTEGQIKFQITNPYLCSMKWPQLEGKVLSIRTWKPKPWSSAQEIIDIFEAGYGPEVSKYEGFQMYLGAKVGNDSHPDLAFFLNIFDTQSQADFANDQAVAFSNGEGEFRKSPCGGLIRTRAELINKQTAQLKFAFLEPKRKRKRRLYPRPYYYSRSKVRPYSTENENYGYSTEKYRYSGYGQ